MLKVKSLKKIILIFNIAVFLLFPFFITKTVFAQNEQQQNQTYQPSEEEIASFSNLLKLLIQFGITETDQSSKQMPNAQTGSYGEKLVNDIKNVCFYNGQPGAVNNDNVSCLDNVNISTRDILKESAITHGALQCVGFVRAVVVAITGSDVCLTAGSALECTSDNAYNFIYANSGKQIQTGDLPIWDFPPYGHIAYVTKVNGSKYFDVAEANFTNGGALYRGSVQIRHATTNETGLIGWLTKKI